MKPPTYRIKGSEPVKSEVHRGPGAIHALIQWATGIALQQHVVVLKDNKALTYEVRLTENQLNKVFFASASSLVDSNEEEEIFGSYTYAETVGLWMKYGRQPGGNLLSPFISTDSFEFSPAEFLDLRERLDQTIRKYAKLPRASGALEDLNTGFFRHQTLEESRSFLTEHLEHFLGRARSLNRRYLLAVNGYARRSAFRSRRDLAERLRELNALKDLMKPAASRKERRRLATEIRGYWSAYRRRWYQDMSDPKTDPGPEVLATEAAVVEELALNLNREQAAAALALSHLTVEPDLSDPAIFRELVEELEALVREIDEAGIYQLPLAGAAAATASRQLQRLENILERLSTTYAHLGELEPFYARRHYWYAQPARLRRLLAPLLELPDSDWEAAFSAWYFDRCLEEVPLLAVNQLRTTDLSGYIDEEAPLLAEGGGISWLSPGDALPEKTEVIVDLTGGERPKGFMGVWQGVSSVADGRAHFHALAGSMDARLTLLQPFQPLSPAPWSAVLVSEPLPTGAGRVGVQVQENASWETLEDWAPQACEHLRLYLPLPIPEEDGKKLLAYFDRLLLESDQLTIFHNWSQSDITQALLTDGVNPEFLAAALLRAAEACTEEPFDREALVAVGRELLTRCGVQIPTVHPLTQALMPLLQKELPEHFLTLHQPWRDTFLPLVVQAPSGQKTILLPAGRLPGLAEPYQEALRQRELRIAGMNCLEIDAVNCWEDATAEARRIAEKIRG